MKNIMICLEKMDIGGIETSVLNQALEYKRRGIKVFETKGKTIQHRHNTPDREGWTSTNPVEFYKKVEDWDD